MKLSIFINNLSAGGRERQLFYLCKTLVNHCSIQLFIFNEDIFFNEIFALPLQFVTIKKENRYKVGTLLKVYKKLDEFSPDIIQAWDNVTHSLALPFMVIRRVKVINSSIRYSGNLKRTLKFRLIRKIAFATSHKLISNSRAGLVVENLLDSKKAVLIYNGFDLNSFQKNRTQIPDELKAKVNLFKHTVVMVGRFVAAKDYITFLQAAKLVIARHPSVGFFCIGDGPERRWAQIEAGTHLNKNIIFLGERHDVLSIIGEFDIGVLLTNTDGHAEGISNAIMEYMAAGLPVIATRAGGNPELVKNNVCGYLVPSFAPEIVAEKILFLLENEKDRKSMGLNGSEIIKNDFSMEKMSLSFLSLYRDLIRD